jgi:hypothetical protein
MDHALSEVIEPIGKMPTIGGLNMIRLGLLISLILVLTMACKSSNPQIYQGVEIKLVSLQRMASFQQGLATLRPTRPGDEIALIQVEFKSTSGQKELKLNHSEMIVTDAQGAKHNPSEDLTFTLNDKSPLPWDIGFPVPKGAQLKTLELGGTKFDLTNVPAMQSPSP